MPVRSLQELEQQLADLEANAGRLINRAVTRTVKRLVLETFQELKAPDGAYWPTDLVETGALRASLRTRAEQHGVRVLSPLIYAGLYQDRLVPHGPIMPVKWERAIATDIGVAFDRKLRPITRVINGR